MHLAAARLTAAFAVEPEDVPFAAEWLVVKGSEAATTLERLWNIAPALRPHVQKIKGLGKAYIEVINYAKIA